MDSPVVDIKKAINQLIDVDLLIELVKEQPIIWDRSAEGYRNKELCSHIWENISRTIFDSYDSWGEEQKVFVGKLIRKKWTSSRDIWQRTYRKQKEAMQNGENFEVKDETRYDKLKFLAKVYDRMDHLQPAFQDKLDPNLRNFENPPSPQVDLNIDNFSNINNTEFQRTFFNLLMDHKNLKKLNHTTPTQKKKIENNNEMNTRIKNDQVGNLISTTKKRSSSMDNREIGGFQNTKSPKRELSSCSPLREEPTSNPNNRFVKSSPKQSPQKLESSCPDQRVKEEDISKSNFSGDSNNSPDVKKITDQKRKISETEDEQTPKKKTALEKNSSNSQSENFLKEVIKPRIEDFDKFQTIDFFFEILKPLIKDFDKHKLLDFQIEALQSIKKIEGK